jgi:hypothetical protein
MKTAPTAAPAPTTAQAPVASAEAPKPHPGSLATGTLAPEKSPLALADADLASRYGLGEPAAIQATDPAEGPESEGELEELPAEPEAPAGDESTATDGEDDAAADPAAPAETPKLAAEFTIRDAEGELEVPRDITIEFVAGKKKYALPLDRVVRMAQSAPMAEALRVENEDLRGKAERAEHIESVAQQLQEEIETNNSIYERMLQDENFYLEVRERYEAENTPEKRAERERAAIERDRKAVQSERERLQQQEHIRAVAEAVTTRIVPRIQALSEQYKNVEWEEIRDRWYFLTSPLLAPDGRGGVAIPPGKIQAAEALLPDLEKWVQARSAKVAQASRSTTDAANKKVTEAQHRAVAAKRQLARAAAPALTHANTATPDKPREKPIKTSSDAVERIVERAERRIREGAT